MKIANAVVFAVIVGASAPGTLVAAEHTHQEVKPRHGGVVVEVSDVEYELVKRDATFVIHVSDHGKPISTKGWSGTMRASRLSARCWFSKAPPHGRT